MLVQGFIDVVGTALTGSYSSNIYVHVIGGGARTKCEGNKGWGSHI